MTLTSGLSVRMPNDQLVVPDVTINNQSGAFVVNTTQPDLVLNSIQAVNANDLTILGRNFLSAVYLMVNQDAGLFAMWKANPTSDLDLVAVDTAGNEINTFCAMNPPPNSTINSSTGTDAGAGNSSSNSNSSGPSAGPIVGGVFGCVAAVGLLGALFWYRRTKSAGRNTGEEYGMTRTVARISYYKPRNEPYDKAAPGSSPALLHELHSDAYGLQPNSHYELAG